MLAEVRHQAEGVRTLRRAIDTQSTAPLLLLGQDGVGKKTSALHTVQELFCQDDRAVGCRCAACYQVQRFSHPDLQVLAATDKDITVSAVRDLIGEVQSYPTAASVRCFIIDGADRMTTAAGTALLKTLEEPPPLSMFILLAEDRGRVLPAIQSRCTWLHFNLLPESFLSEAVRKLEPDETKALVYSRMGEGSVGAALQLCVGGKLGFRDQVLECLLSAAHKNLFKVFSIVDELEKELSLFQRILAQLIHDVLVVSLDPMRVVNLDRTNALQTLWGKVPVDVWLEMSSKLDSLLHARAISVPFHIKSLLATSF